MMLIFELKSMSTDAVLHPVEALSINYDNFENSMATFFNLAKALNSISHRIFFRKPSAYGFFDNAVIVFDHFLSTKSSV